MVSTSVPHSKHTLRPDPTPPSDGISLRDTLGSRRPKHIRSSQHARTTSCFTTRHLGNGAWRAAPSGPRRSLRFRAPRRSCGFPQAPFPLSFHLWPRQCKPFPKHDFRRTQTRILKPRILKHSSPKTIKAAQGPTSPPHCEARGPHQPGGGGGVKWVAKQPLYLLLSHNVPSNQGQGGETTNHTTKQSNLNLGSGTHSPLPRKGCYV